MRHRRIRGTGWRCGALAAAAFLLAPAAGASAHSVVSSVRPADGAVLTTPPSAVVVTYAEPVLSVEGARAMVGGRDVAGPPRLAPGDARRLVIPVSGSTPGRYRVSWTVVGADAHPVSGMAAFRVRAPAGITRLIRTAGAEAVSTGRGVATGLPSDGG